MPNIFMAFIRKKRVNGKTYYYVVESYKEKGKSKQRVLYYVGNINSLIKKLKGKDK